MIKNKIRSTRFRQYSLEIAIAVCSLTLGHVGYKYLVNGIWVVGNWVWLRLDLLALVVPIWALVLPYDKSYEYLRNCDTSAAIVSLLKTTCIGGLLIFSGLAIFKIPVSRLFIGCYLLTYAMLLWFERWIILLFVRKGILHVGQVRNIVIVGINQRSKRFLDLLKAHKEWHMSIIGFVNCQDDDLVEFEGVPVIGKLSNIAEVMVHSQVDEIYFIISRSMFQEVEPVVALCQKMGIRFRFSSDLFDHRLGRITVDQVYEWPFITYEPTFHREAGLFAKRVFDIVFAIVALIATMPLLLLIAALIKIMSQGPVFFLQERCGRNRKLFRMLKFRTMVDGAELMRTQISGLNEMTGPVFKISRDPRVTPFGRVLRKYSLDELPQFINVLVGDMSIVGPRPPLLSEVMEYDYWQRRRLSLRPGLTCIWQVSGRNDIPFEDWMKLDLDYIDHWSFWLDMKLIFKTVSELFKGNGR